MNQQVEIEQGQAFIEGDSAAFDAVITKHFRNLYNSQKLRTMESLLKTVSKAYFSTFGNIGRDAYLFLLKKTKKNKKPTQNSTTKGFVLTLNQKIVFYPPSVF